MKRNRWKQLGDFVLGKGFYIVLFLCVAALGISGYYLIRSVSGSGETTDQTVTGNPTVVLPDSSAQTAPKAETPTEQKTPTKQSAVQEQEDDPEALPQQQAQDQTRDVVYTWPVKGQLLRDFAVETLSYDQTMGDWRTHAGVDIAAEVGRKVWAAGDGTVSQVYDDPMMGVTVVIEHPDGVTSTYSNRAADPLVAVGDTVETGTEIGAVGETAIAESAMEPHLHLEMSKEGAAVDPVTLLPDQI